LAGAGAGVSLPHVESGLSTTTRRSLVPPQLG